jgi:hypothetical protein
MTSRDLPSSGVLTLPIDRNFLARQVPDLAHMRRRCGSWDDLGEKTARDFLHPRGQVVRSGVESSQTSEWSLAKELVHDVLISGNPQHDAIRKRLGDLSEPSTPRLLSTLSLWLAGVLKISVSVTLPMVAVMLYAVGEAGGDPKVLLE